MYNLSVIMSVEVKFSHPGDCHSNTSNVPVVEPKKLSFALDLLKKQDGVAASYSTLQKLENARDFLTSKALDHKDFSDLVFALCKKSSSFDHLIELFDRCPQKDRLSFLVWKAHGAASLDPEYGEKRIKESPKIILEVLSSIAVEDLSSEDQLLIEAFKKFEDKALESISGSAERIDSFDNEASLSLDGREFSHKAIEHIFNLGSFLLKPANLMLKNIVRIFVVDLEPSMHGQKKSAALEISYRTALFVGSLILSPFALSGSILALPICTLTSLAKKSLSVLAPSIKITPSNPAQSLHVISYNTLLMPEFITLRNKHRPSSERVDEIADKLIEKNADLISLQEVFNAQSARQLAKRLSEAGYYIVRHLSPRPWTLNSGLFIASKFPIHNPKFQSHSVLFGHDKMASKGVLAVDIKIGDDVITLANTHLNGGGSFKGLSSYHARMIQSHQMSQFLQQRGQNAQIVTGDMNVSAIDEGNFEPEYYIANKLYYENLKDPLALEPKEVRGSLVDKITRIHNEVLDNYRSFKPRNPLKRLEEFTDRFASEGGCLPSSLYEGAASNYEMAKEGTVVDMDHSNSGWTADECSVKEVRLDHIYIRKDRGLAIKEQTIDPMKNPKGQILSDHLALEAQIDL